MTLAPFISSTDLGNYIRQTLVDDELAVIAVDSACQLVRSYLEQQINYLEDDEVLLSGTGTEAILLPELPVTEVTEVILLDPDGAEDETLDEGTDYRVGYGGILWIVDACCWPLGHLNVQVTYSHGYAITEPGSGDPAIATVPSDIRLVALELAAATYNAGATVSAGGGTKTSETMANYSYTLSDASVEVARAASTDRMGRIDRYRVRSVA